MFSLPKSNKEKTAQSLILLVFEHGLVEYLFVSINVIKT